ncbi:hypothetical protein AAY473_034366 [Plecturocebus cupreus]
MCHHTWLIFYSFKSHSITQAGVQWSDLVLLQPLQDRNSSVLVSKVDGITDACHHAQLPFVFLVDMGVSLRWTGWSLTPDLK